MESLAPGAVCVVALPPLCANDDPTEKILVMPKSGHNDCDVEFVIPEITTGRSGLWTASTY
jgi:hypothetical protein